MDLTQFLTALGAETVRGLNIENPRADRYVSVVGRLMAHASKWSAVSAAGIKCVLSTSNPIGERIRCREGAIASCVVCEKPACFNHSMVSPRDGTVICFACVGSAQAHVKEHGAPSSPGYGAQCLCQDAWRCDPRCPVHGEAGGQQARREHLQTLGLEDDADLEDIRSAYKDLARKNHPDKVKGPRKARAQKRMAEINAAYEWLTKNAKEAA
jgi:hypothetical protein